MTAPDARTTSLRTRSLLAAIVLSAMAVFGAVGPANAADTAVKALPVVTGVTPTIAGTAKVGSALTATAGTWKPAPITLKYQWLRAGVAITGATASKYTLVAVDAGKRISVTVTGTRSGYTKLTKVSAQTVAVAPLVRTLTAAPVPAIAGTAVIGGTLTAKAGTWSPAPVTLKYAWKRNGVTIAGVAGAAYKLTALDVGKRITVVVTGSKSGYTTVAKTSPASAAVLAAKKYTNCTALNLVFPHGVGRAGAKDSVSGTAKPVTTFTVSTEVYTANTASDRDKDGIACEKK